jgi:hypothetical protein
MKFLVVILGIKGLFYLLERLGKREKSDRNAFDESPSEHNVWW